MTTACLALAAHLLAAAPVDPVYLFSYFLNNGEDGLHLAWSEDGLVWQTLGGGRSYLAPRIGDRPLMRDPCLHLGPDGRFRMTWTTGWGSHGVGYAESADLLTWSEQRNLPVMEGEPAARNVWAPEIFYDQPNDQYLIYWATTITGRFPATDGSGDDGYNHRMYLTTTRDFQAFTPTRLMYDGGFNVIDATIVASGGQHYLILKDETLKPVAKNLRVAVSRDAVGPYGPAGPPFTPSWVEGPTVTRLGDLWAVYFDEYTRDRYGAMVSADLLTWRPLSEELKLPDRARHGTVLKVPRQVVQALIDAG